MMDDGTDGVTCVYVAFSSRLFWYFTQNREELFVSVDIFIIYKGSPVLACSHFGETLRLEMGDVEFGNGRPLFRH